MKLKENKGIGLSDAIIAIAIFVIFSGVIISISYNIYLQSNFIKRNSTATEYIVDLFEYAKTENLETISSESLENYVLEKYGQNNVTVITNKANNDSDIGKGYTMYIDVNDIKDKYPDSYEPNFEKQIDVTVYYKLGGKIKTVTMSTLVSR